MVLHAVNVLMINRKYTKMWKKNIITSKKIRQHSFSGESGRACGGSPIHRLNALMSFAPGLECYGGVLHTLSTEAREPSFPAATFPASKEISRHSVGQ